MLNKWQRLFDSKFERVASQLLKAQPSGAGFNSQRRQLNLCLDQQPEFLLGSGLKGSSSTKYLDLGTCC